MLFTKSKIFLYFCLSFAIGILIASFLPIPTSVLLGGVIISIIFISIFWREKKLVIAGFCVIFLMLGVYRFHLAAEEKSLISQYNDLKENIIIQGIISEEPDVRMKDVQYVMKIQNLPCEIIPQKAEFPLCGISQGEGKILVTLPHYPAYQYGDLVELEGKLKTPMEFDDFSYKDYLAKDGIHSAMYSPTSNLISSGNGNFIYAAIFQIKNKFKEKLKSILPEPENSFLAGLLLGERSGLSQKLKDDFAIAGVSHIVAVSGFNVTIIAIIILELALALGFSRGQSFWISLAAINMFIIMVGAPASAIRAGIMGGLVLVAVRAGRLNSVANAIVFAAVLMLAINPKILRFDAGFQLSFLAVIGIVWLYPVSDGYFSVFSGYLSVQDSYPDAREKKTTIFSKIKSMLLLTVSAQIMALPILLYDFGRLSVISPIANILILPFVPLAMALGFIAGILDFIWLPLAKIIGYFSWLVLTYQIRIIEFLAALPWAAVEINNFSGMLFVLYYLVIGFILIKNYKKRTARMIQTD